MNELLRKNIVNLKPYSSARTEFTGKADVYLDANEHYRDFVEMKDSNRYPDPKATVLRKKIEEVLGLPFEHTVLGSGSDELIDNLIRATCTPGKDLILILLRPTGRTGSSPTSTTWRWRIPCFHRSRSTFPL